MTLKKYFYITEFPIRQPNKTTNNKIIIQKLIYNFRNSFVIFIWVIFVCTHKSLSNTKIVNCYTTVPIQNIEISQKTDYNFIN